jgi:glycosyltransferase involved in cell wall biosynthesis
MRVLVVATNSSDVNLPEKILKGAHQRIEYLELAALSDFQFVDYSIVAGGKLTGRLESLLRFDLRQAAAVARLVREKGFQIVFSLSERVGIPLTFLLPKSVKHYVIQHHPMSRMKILFEKVLGAHKHWSRIITISRAERDGLKQALGLAPDRVISLHCPVDTQFFCPPGKPDAQAQDKIESLGLSHRDYPTLIKAMRTLPHIPCSFRVGSAWVKHGVDFNEQELPENISLQPYVSPDELRKIILKNRFLVVTMRNDTQWSAGCTTVQIAQSMGKAVVATDLPGLREYVSNRETGILVKPEDPDALADAIRYLWEHPEEANAMGARGRKFMEDKFSLDHWLIKAQEILQGNIP